MNEQGVPPKVLSEPQLTNLVMGLRCLDRPIFGERAIDIAETLAALRRRVEEVEAERDAFHAECDKVGIPHNTAMLVRHHRANAGMAATALAAVGGEEDTR